MMNRLVFEYIFFHLLPYAFYEFYEVFYFLVTADHILYNILFIAGVNCVSFISESLFK